MNFNQLPSSQFQQHTQPLITSSVNPHLQIPLNPFNQYSSGGSSVIHSAGTGGITSNVMPQLPIPSIGLGAAIGRTNVGGHQTQQQNWNLKVGEMYSDTSSSYQQSRREETSVKYYGQKQQSRDRSPTPERSRHSRGGSRRRRSRSSSRDRGKRRRKGSSESSSRSSSSDSRDRYSRSRSRERDRDFRDNGGDRDYRSSDYDGGRRNRRGGRSSPSHSTRRREPDNINYSKKVMLPSLPSYADRDTVNILIARQGFHPIDIRIVRRNTEAGTSRVFGFVEFSEVSQAQSWVDYNHGYLRFDDGYQVRMEYSREKDGEGERRAGPGIGQPLTDWTCAKCTINNFNRRTNCFKCGTSRTESEELEAKGYAMVGVSPCDTILVRELPITATEESIRTTFSQRSPPHIIIQRVFVSPSRRYALVQMRSADEASYMLNVLNRNVMTIDNCTVIITFARQSLNQILIMENVNIIKSQSGISSTSIHEDPTNSAAQLAQNAIRIAQMSRQPGTVVKLDAPMPQSISTPFGYLPSYPTPNPKEFQLEPSTGYYYDSQTGFYYDPKTNYYYNSATNACTYINCEGGDMDLKRKLQEEEITDQARSSSAIISAPPVKSQEQEKPIEISTDLRSSLQQVAENLQAQNVLLENTIKERSKGVSVSAHFLELIISKIKKLESVKEELEQKIDKQYLLRNYQNDPETDTDDIEILADFPAPPSRKSRKKNHRSHTREKRRKEDKNISRRKEDKKRTRARSRSQEPISGDHSPQKNSGKNIQSPKILRGSSPLPVPHPATSAVLAFSRALSDGIKDRSNMKSVSANNLHPPPLSSIIPNLPSPLLLKNDTPRRYPDNDTHWAAATNTNSAGFFFQPPTKKLVGAVTPNIFAPALTAAGTRAETDQLRMVQELALLEKTQEELHLAKMVSSGRSSGTDWPLIRAGQPSQPSVTLQQQSQFFKKQDFLNKALRATKKRLKEQVENFEEKRKLNQRQKDREKLAGVNFCFNCARYGHTEAKCTRPQASESVLEKAIRSAKEKVFHSDALKQIHKIKADQYKLVRNDPFQQRLREYIPSGLIKRESLIHLCERCANFGHTNFSLPRCKRPPVTPQILAYIKKKLEEFKNTFFVHLNEENLVDLSAKFQLFNTMDAIERGGYADPIGVQLQSISPDGQVTMQELKLCSHCAEIGHKQQDCKGTEATRECYEKMLKLVVAYRALVKEQGTLFINTLPKNSDKKVPEKNPTIVTLDSDSDDNGANNQDDDDEPIEIIEDKTSKENESERGDGLLLIDESFEA